MPTSTYSSISGNSYINISTSGSTHAYADYHDYLYEQQKDREMEKQLEKEQTIKNLSKLKAVM